MKRRTVLVASLPILLAVTQDKGPASLDPGRWSKLDVESRWLVYRESAGDATARKKLWVKWLAKRKEWDLLEWIVIYDGYRDAGPELELRDPRWVRCAVFSANDPDSHTRSQAQKALQERRPAVVRSWLKRYPKVVTPALAKILKKLDAQKLARVDVSGYPPPLDVAALLRPLQNPRRRLPTLEVGQPAEAGTLYAHQVERAFDALVHSGQRSLPWQRKVLAWGANHNAVVRRTALLTLTKLSPSAELARPLLSIVKSAGDPEDVKVALMAASYVAHPEVWLFLHHVARSPIDPGFRVAVSRLAGIGNGFTAEHLRGLSENDSLATGDKTFVAKELARLAQRVAAIDLGKNPDLVRTMLVNAAWAKLADDPLAGPLETWTKQRIQRDLDNVKVKRAVAALATGYTAEPSLGTAAQKQRMTRLVQKLAASIRDR